MNGEPPPPTLGRRVLRILFAAWMALVLATAVAFATGRLDLALPLAGLVGLVGALLLVTPAMLFLTHAVRYGAADTPREMRRSALGSGATNLVAGALLTLTMRSLELGGLFLAPPLAVALLGAGVLARVLTLAPAGPPASGTPLLRHRGATVAGAVTMLAFIVLAPKVMGGGPAIGRPTEANMRSDLRNLVAQQDAFFLERHLYATLADLGDAFRPDFSHADITVAAESTRFVATATSTRTSLICLVWTGSPAPPADSVHGAADGVPECWER